MSKSSSHLLPLDSNRGGRGHGRHRHRHRHGWDRSLQPLTKSSPSRRMTTSSTSSSAHWLQRAGAVLASEARESKGQSWLTNRASSTDLLADYDDVDDDDDDHDNDMDDYRPRQHQPTEETALVNDEFPAVQSRLFSRVVSRHSLHRRSKTDPNPIEDDFSSGPTLFNDLDVHIDDDDDDENENGNRKQGQIILAQREQLRQELSRQHQHQLDRDRLEDAEIDRLTRPYHVDTGFGTGAGADAGTGVDAGLGVATAVIVGDFGFFFTFGKWLVDGILGLSVSSTMDDLDRNLDHDDDHDNEEDVRGISQIVEPEVKNKDDSTVGVDMIWFLTVATQTLLS